MARGTSCKITYSWCNLFKEGTAYAASIEKKIHTQPLFNFIGVIGTLQESGD